MSVSVIYGFLCHFQLYSRIISVKKIINLCEIKRVRLKELHKLGQNCLDLVEVSLLLEQLMKSSPRTFDYLLQKVNSLDFLNDISFQFLLVF